MPSTQEAVPTNAAAPVAAAPVAAAVAVAVATTEAPKQPPPKKEKKKPDGNFVIPPPKPKLTKAERRALQEQQRGAKSEAQGGGGGGGSGGKGQGPAATSNEAANAASTKPAPSSSSSTNDTASHAADAAVSSSSTTATAGTATAGTRGKENNNNNPNADSKIVALVSHLTPYQDPADVFASGATLRLQHTQHSANLHPAVVELGYQYAAGLVRGGNARCRAMLQCFATVLSDFEPDNTAAAAGAGTGTAGADKKKGDVRAVLDNTVFKPAFHYWTNHCRPHSVGMGNAFSFLKAAIASLDRECPYDEMVSELQETMKAYQGERIDYADQAIADHACQKLYDDEVILTYGHAEVVAEILQLAAESKDRRLRVIVVDSRPLLEGRVMLEKLRRANIECSYILLNALTYVLQDVTKVLLGASALMSDGSVLGRVGTACVALAAHAQHIPVLVCSETYKISNRVQLEALTGNEIGNPEAVSSETLEDWKELDNLKLLNLVYDLTPASFVSGIVTEFGIVPPTSVAVLLREMNPQDFKSSDE
jgi:translation initiation factor eIF-2B subunit delta